jgi:cyclic-di-GMP phosphodiesterase TipF (flagellum assembly factor)
MADSAPSGGLGLLDYVVLIAMAVTAVAFTAGLHIQAGLPLLASVIAGAALYLVAAASYLFIARASHSPDSQLEGALEIIDSGLQRIDRVETDISRLGQAFTDLPGGHRRIEELASDLESVHARIEGLRTDLQKETEDQRDRITNDLGKLEGLIKQLSHDLTGGAGISPSSAASIAASMPERGAPAAEPKDEQAGGGDLIIDEEMETVIAAVADILDGGEDAETAEIKTVVTVTEMVEVETVEVSELPDTAAVEVERGMIGTLQQAIEAGRVDLYAQPIVSLPSRKVRYYESVTRIRNAADELILPGAYIQEAENAGIMPLIDNVLLVKSVQLLRRRRPDSKIKGVFCNISAQSLLDADYFPELVVFLEENGGLSDNLIFELRQPEIMGLTRGQLGALDTLGALGFNFALDHIVDLDIDFIELSDRYFRFLKLDAATFFDGMQEKGAPLPPPDMVRYLEGFGLQLIVEKVEEERTVSRLVDAGVELAEGGFFGEPKQVTPDFLQELEAADTA